MMTVTIKGDAYYCNYYCRVADITLVNSEVILTLPRKVESKNFKIAIISDNRERRATANQPAAWLTTEDP